MGCAPSATTASPTGHRVSLADDKNAAEVMATDGIRTAAASADMRRQDPGATDRSATRVNGDVPLSKSSLDEMYLGSVPVKQPTMSVLLLFPRADAQCNTLERAAVVGRYDLDVARSADAALQSFVVRQHDVVVVDTRQGSDVDAEAFARLLRSTPNNDYSVLVGVRSLPSKQKDDSSTLMLALLKAGFNRQFFESQNVGVCLAELQSLEYGEVRAQYRLRVAQSLVVAVDSTSDAIEITDENHHTQYVNPAFERLFGYKGEEIFGKNSSDLTRSDCTKPDVINSIHSHLRAGQPWDGSCHMRRKTGENLCLKCRFIPVAGHSGKLRHYVAVRSVIGLDSRASSDMSNGVSHLYGTGVFQMRKESVARIPSMTFEAPITKVINMICNIRDESPNNVSAALENVLEALRSSELYAPHLLQHAREDKVVNDLVEGLMTVDEDHRITRKVSMVKHGSLNSDTAVLAHKLHNPTALAHTSPDVQKLLESEEDWGFSVIDLELLTKRSPLVHLAMKTLSRFAVVDFLRVDEKVLLNWLQLVESNYHAENPYHNSTHAADVMHATSYFLNCEKLKVIFNEMDEVASLLAAIVHDLDHPGKTNSFLVNSESHLSLLYNDLAVLESHHISLAFRLTTHDDKANIFKYLDRDDYKAVRQQMVDMVLATEMTRHFEHVSRFVSVIDQPLPFDDDAADALSGTGSLTGVDRQLAMTARLSLPENRTLIKRMLIKCADVSNPARPVRLCVEWANRIAREYCKQTDDEKLRGLPVVMPVFDSSACNVPKSQTSFIEFFISDMFEAWTSFCGLADMMQQVRSNYSYWKQQEVVESQNNADQQTNVSS